MSRDNNAWRPAYAPDVRCDFQQAQSGQEKPEYGHKPASKSELEKLLAERDRPVLAPEYTIMGQTQKTVQNTLAKERESRIKELMGTLEKQRHRARDDFNINADDYLLKKAWEERER